MKVSMTIASDGTTTKVSREYEPTATTLHEMIDFTPVAVRETPALDDVIQAVATAAATAHRPTHEGA